MSRLFGLNILLTLTLGSRTHFLLESLDIIDDRLLRQKMLVFDRTRPSLYSGIFAAQSTYTTFL